MIQTGLYRVTGHSSPTDVGADKLVKRLSEVYVRVSSKSNMT
jgi:hypothetical protein